jgi:hypothetical protein
MKIKLIIIALIFCQSAIAQIPTNMGFSLCGEFSDKNLAVKAEGFLLKEILKSPEDIVQFKLERIASSMSGDLTSLIYRCEKKQIEGMILAFYGDYWNDTGDIYKGFIFKNLPKNEALEFLSKISSTIEEQKDFLSKDNYNNVSFQYEDISVVISKDMEMKIRIFLNGFDADWDNYAFARTKRRIENNLN